MTTLNAMVRQFTGLWRYAVLIAFAFIFGFPFLWTFYSSFKTTSEVVANAWALPTAPTLNGYIEVIQNTSFGKYYVNSIILTFVAAPLVTLVSALADIACVLEKAVGQVSNLPNNRQVGNLPHTFIP